ncbi:hypothetical protein ACFSTI_07755 [Rhizorhabdus histidinilytica]
MSICPRRGNDRAGCSFDPRSPRRPCRDRGGDRRLPRGRRAQPRSRRADRAGGFPGARRTAAGRAGSLAGEDGSRVRALRYTGSRIAAATLVPPGCWIDTEGSEVVVAGAEGEWSGTHAVEAIALCIAALRARLAGPP